MQQPTTVQNTAPVDLGFSFETSPVSPQVTQVTQQQSTQPTQSLIGQPQSFQPQHQPQHQPQNPVNQPLYPPQNNTQNGFNGLNMGYNNPTTFPQQNPVYGHGQQASFGYGQQQQGQYGMMGGYPQQPQQQQGLYGQQFQQQMGQGMGAYNAPNLAFGQVPQYQQANSNHLSYHLDQYGQHGQQQSWNQGISLSTTQPAQQNLGNISLQTTTHSKK